MSEGRKVDGKEASFHPRFNRSNGCRNLRPYCRCSNEQERENSSCCFRLSFVPHVREALRDPVMQKHEIMHYVAVLLVSVCSRSTIRLPRSTYEMFKLYLMLPPPPRFTPAFCVGTLRHRAEPLLVQNEG